MHRVSGPVVCRGLIASPLHPWRPVAPGGGDGPVARRAGWAQKMWQNVSKISPLFCGKIFEIFCHGLPAGGGQLFRTSTIFLPLLTPTFRQTPVNDSRHCVKFCCRRKSNSSMLCTGYQPGLSQTSLVLPSAITACVPERLVLLSLRHVHFVHGPSGPSCNVFRDQTCASALIAHRVSGSVFC